MLTVCEKILKGKKKFKKILNGKKKFKKILKGKKEIQKHSTVSRSKIYRNSVKMLQKKVTSLNFHLLVFVRIPTFADRCNSRQF